MLLTVVAVPGGFENRARQASWVWENPVVSPAIRTAAVTATIYGIDKCFNGLAQHFLHNVLLDLPKPLDPGPSPSSNTYFVDVAGAIFGTRLSPGVGGVGLDSVDDEEVVSSVFGSSFRSSCRPLSNGSTEYLGTM